MDSDNNARNALDNFAKWSNYLLVTTVAAVGWIANGKQVVKPDWIQSATLWMLGLSVVFGIFTLALVPHIAQNLQPESESIFRVQAEFSILGIRLRGYLTQSCRPQHLLFILGVLLYTGGAAGMPWQGLVLAILACIYGLLSRPRM